MGLLLFFISIDNLFFKILNDGNLNYLVVIFEEQHVLQRSTVFRKVALNHRSGHTDPIRFKTYFS
jgi:hypothetical protein